MGRIRSALIPLAAILAFFSIAWLDPFRDAVSSGNKEYDQQKFNNAKRYYQKAEEYAPTEDDRKKLSFNIADADYMLEDFDSAQTGFKKAVQSDDPDVQKRALFNTGNAYLKQGNYREAINAYINALKIDPDYVKAKKNIEYVLKKMNDNNNQKNKQDNKNKDKQDNNDTNNKQNRNASQQGNKNQDKDRNVQKGRDSMQGRNQMNREQVQNILRSLQKSPVRRQKGSSDERRKLEKFW